MPAAAGTHFGRYKVRCLLAVGGMGEIYEAEDDQLGRTVALKVLPPEVACDQQRVQRFMQEAKAASALNHPNILTIHEIGRSDDTCYIVTEFIEGVTLRHYMAARARTKVGEVIDIAIQVADALARAHQAGIVHRDVKPENIMVRADGIVKVLDFGIAKLSEGPHSGADEGAKTRAMVNTEPGAVLGTPLYMSPEQVRALDVDPRTDIFSLGVVLYEMIAGRAPFEGPTTGAVMAAIIDTEPPPLGRFAPNLPRQLERIVMKALAKDREERYQVVKDLMIDLKSLRRELEFEAELDRTTTPELRDALAATRGGAQTSGATGTKSAAPATGRTLGGARFAGKLGRHWKIVGLAVAALAVVAAASLFVRTRRAQALTERDTILLADFVNTTGDAVFDGTLKQALAVQLGQSPFLNIASDDRVREALRFMGRPPDERVTREVAREICQRQGLKALLAGSISGLGSHYVLTLEAVNAQTGDTIAREQVEAEGKEQVLKKLGEASSRLRGQLGESLSSLKKFDAPIEQATTSSLEALKAFSLGDELRAKGTFEEAVPFYKRATELDPNFALAYARLAVMYFNTRQPEIASRYAETAFELRERVSERERLYIESRYHGDVIGDMDKTAEVLRLWKRTYPRDYVPYNNLALYHNQTGGFEQAITEARETMRLNSNFAVAYANVSLGFVGLNRFDEAKAVIEQGQAQKIDTMFLRAYLYGIAFIQGDQAAMERHAEWAKGKPAEFMIANQQAGAAANSGRLRQARELSGRAIDLAQRNNAEAAAWFAALEALRDAAFGDCRQVKAQVERALGIKRTRNSLSRGGLALALCGEAGQALPLADELAKQFPKDTYVNSIWLPTIRAAIEINRGNPTQAVQLLRPAARYEVGIIAGGWPAYVRGLAYLRQGSGAEAAAEFRKLLEHKGVLLISSFNPPTNLYPLAQLGLARASALAGDMAASRKAYQDFFAFWKDADPDIPVLQEAGQEYAKMK